MTKTRNVLNLSAGGVRGGEECKVFVCASCDHVQPYGCMDEAQERVECESPRRDTPMETGGMLLRYPATHNRKDPRQSHPEGHLRLTPTPEGRLHTHTHTQNQGDKLSIFAFTPHTHARRVSSQHPRPKGVFTLHTSHPAPSGCECRGSNRTKNVRMPLRCLMWCSYFLNCQP